MTANRPIEAVKKFVRDLQLEHYDLLHKHGYADYRLDEEPVEGYTEDALHLTELYERDLTLLLRQEIQKARQEPVGDAIEIKVPLKTMQFVLSKIRMKPENIAKRLLLHDTYLIDKWTDGTADEYNLEIYMWRLKILASLTHKYNWAIFLMKPENIPELTNTQEGKDNEPA